jgi:hypothetical protein
VYRLTVQKRLSLRPQEESRSDTEPEPALGEKVQEVSQGTARGVQHVLRLCALGCTRAQRLPGPRRKERRPAHEHLLCPEHQRCPAPVSKPLYRIPRTYARKVHSAPTFHLQVAEAEGV